MEKYRAYHRPLGRMFYSYSQDDAVFWGARISDSIFETFVHAFISLFRDDPQNLLMRYMGLTDKNGREVYKGDIINMPFNRYPQKWEVKELTAYGLAFHRITGKPYPAAYKYNQLRHFDQAEIIGNIWENPELVEAQNGQ